MSEKTGIIWHDRKRNFLGLPCTFTVYEFSNDRFFVDRGLINSREDEVRLYRITDVFLTRSLWQKIIGTGTIHVSSADHSLGNFEIINIKDSMKIKEQLSALVETSRKQNRVYTRENMNTGGPGFGPGPGPDFGPGPGSDFGPGPDHEQGTDDDDDPNAPDNDDDNR